MFLLLLLRRLADGRHRLRGASLLAAAAPSLLLLRLAGLLLDVERRQHWVGMGHGRNAWGRWRLLENGAVLVLEIFAEEVFVTDIR
jgi:hypothetical protein